MALGALIGTVLVAGAAVCLTSGCTTLGYYGQSVGGHLSLMSQAKPVPAWLGEGQTPQSLRTRLELAQRIREFAVSELKLPDNGSYTT